VKTGFDSRHPDKIMRIKIDNFKENPASFFRRIGYVFVRREEDDMSFVRSMSRSGYPRFHIFAHMEQENLVINIHLDQKKETYGSGTRHHGEYENEGTLKGEIERIKKLFK
jgi:hypothetical protein